MPLPRFTEIVDALPETVPFVGPEAIERQTDIPVRARIGANESGFGPSPRVLAAMADAAPQIWRYPDPENHVLRTALAERLGISSDEVTIGEGIDGLMGLIVRMFIAPGDKVVTSLGAYPTLNYHIVGHGGVLELVPYRGEHEDLMALAAAAGRVGAKMVYVANPDNPMGSFWPAPAIEALIAAVPEDCLILLDEAYGELAPADGLPEINTQKANVLRLRTFSKAYGLAGIRCGYAFGDRRIIRAFDRVRNHFGVNRQAQVAALAALADDDYLRQVQLKVAAARDRIGEIAIASGLTHLPSATNFVAVDCGRDGAFAMAVLKGLANRGVFVRKPMVAPHDRCIRISVGPEAEMQMLAEALPQALQDAQGAV